MAFPRGIRYSYRRGSRLNRDVEIKENNMNCFNHPELPALGICKSCGKGLCRECISEVPDGLACKNRCEDRVRFINRILDSNKQALTAANNQVRSGAIFIIVTGLIFCAFGFLPYFISGQKGALFLGIIGAVFVISGLFCLSAKAKYPDLK